jgi:hypothetical protein
MLQLADSAVPRCLSVVGLFIASWVRVSKRPLCGWCGHMINVFYYVLTYLPHISLDK